MYVNTGVLLGVSVAAISCGFRERGVLSRSFGREGGVSEFSWKTLIQSSTQLRVLRERVFARIESGVSLCAWHRRLHSFAIGGGAGILGEGGEMFGAPSS